MVAQCTHALRLLGREHRLDVFADLIADVATAHLLLRFLVERHTLRHTLYTFASWLDAARLQLGDVVEVVDPMASEGVPIRAELIAHSVEINTAQVRLTARGFEQSLWDATFDYDILSIQDVQWEALFNSAETSTETASWEAAFDTDDILFTRARRAARHDALDLDEERDL